MRMKIRMIVKFVSKEGKPVRVRDKDSILDIMRRSVYDAAEESGFSIGSPSRVVIDEPEWDNEYGHFYADTVVTWEEDLSIIA